MHRYFEIFTAVVLIIYIFMGLDDFIWDMTSLISQIFRPNKKDLSLKIVEQEPTKMLAVIIGAWQEDDVIGDVITHFINTQIYPRSMYRIFVGVYPNDAPTIEKVRELEEKFDNVQIIINELPGPTSKAQNINYVFTQIKAYEEKHQCQFASFTVHDSEDVIHPFELKVTNYLIVEHPGIQFPVFPLMEKPTFANFFPNLTRNTYADEFAENHFMTMVTRNRLNAFVPSAGTGFALSRRVVESFNGEDILPRDSLTEDYRLSLTLLEKGWPIYYVLKKLTDVRNDFSIGSSFISTKSMFPYTFKTAVKQKRRWILGITMQSVKFKEIFSTNISATAKYSLYKDQKAKIGNLLAFIGYPIFAYMITSLFIDLPPIITKGTLIWYLSIFITIMMIQRQIFRMVAMYNVYGLRSVFFSTLFPPIIPIRIVWGNIINFTATVQAIRQKYFGSKKEPRKKGKPIPWDKTAHHFLREDILLRFHKRMGDLLINRQYIEPKVLSKILKDLNSREERVFVGAYLLEQGYITEEQCLTCLADLGATSFLKNPDLSYFKSEKFAQLFNMEELELYGVIPLFRHEGVTLFAMTYESGLHEVKRFIESVYKEPFVVCYAYKDVVHKGITDMYQGGVVYKYLPFAIAGLRVQQIIFVLNAMATAEEPTTYMNYTGMKVLPEPEPLKIVPEPLFVE